MTALSRIQFVALGLVHSAAIFDKDELAHVYQCSMTVKPSVDVKDALDVYISVSFKDWLYAKHIARVSDYVTCPPIIILHFYQDKEGKLTGRVEGGFHQEKQVISQELEYIKGW